MTRPRVLAIMLTANRTKMTRRAVASFLSQGYSNKKLLIWDTGELSEFFGDESGLVTHLHDEPHGKSTIGTLRNKVNSFWTEYDIAVHFDSDDWSHPNRISEQVALLQASGKQVCGYRDMLFWRGEQRSTGYYDFNPATRRAIENITPRGEAWIYSNKDPRFCLGTSLCYWRKTWEKKPFPDCPKPGMMSGEDHMWLRDLDRMGISSIGQIPSVQSARRRSNDMALGPNKGYTPAPMMIASIHGGNSSDQYADIERSDNWKRVPEFDQHCRSVMQL